MRFWELYIFTRLIEIFRVKETKSFLSWKENLFTTASAQLAVVPILIMDFGSFSPTSFLANILVLEAVPFTMTLGFLIGAARLVSYYLALAIGWVAWIFLKFETSVIKLFGTAGVSLRPAMSAGLVVAYYALLVGFILYVRLPRREESIWRRVALRATSVCNELVAKFSAHEKKLIAFFAVLVLFDVFLIWRIAAAAAPKNLEMYFLDVGQGDSELVILPTGVKVLIDGGPPNGKALAALGRVLTPSDRSIDIVVMSHPQLDHFGGLIEIVERYRVGVFVSNGLAGTVGAYGDLKRTLAARGVREIALGKGDAIKNGDNIFSVLSPEVQILKSQDINELALVLKLASKNTKALFTGDIGAETEAQVSRVLDGNIDVLKVAHHGSKYSSSASFLAAARPKVSVIEVGKNSYGHPTLETLARLAAVGAKIFRTDKEHTVEAVADGEHIQLFSLP